MKLLIRLTGLLATAALLQCTGTRDLPTTMSQPADSSVQHLASEQQARALIAALSTGKVKFKGNVTFQLGGTGNVANVAPKAKAPVAAGHQASASEARTYAGPPWWVYLVGALVLVGGGFLLRGKLKSPLPL